MARRPAPFGEDEQPANTWIPEGRCACLRPSIADGRIRPATSAAPAMLAVLEHHGLQHTFTHRGIPWQVAGLER